MKTIPILIGIETSFYVKQPDFKTIKWYIRKSVWKNNENLT